MTAPRWSTAEDEALRAAYSTGGIPAALAALPGRSVAGLTKRAHRLGIHSPRAWTAREDRRLEWLWSSAASLRALSRQLGRSPQACHARAAHLGLLARVPRGQEPLSVAAERAGFSPGKVLRVLSWAGVPVRQSFARPGLSRGLRRHRFVDPVDVDEAVAAWVRSG